MATDVERLVATLSADIRGYERELKKATQTTNRELRKIEQRAQQMRQNLSSVMGAGFARLAGGISAGVLAAQAAQAATAYVDMQNALRTTGMTADQVSSTFDQLFAIAQKQGTAIEPLVTLYTSLARSQTELGVSSEAVIKFTDNIALALRVGGTSAQAASGALLQLSQALAGGVVRAEEFNSIVEGAPTILRAVAAGLVEAGGSVGKLRQLVTEGEVSSRAFFEAFQRGSAILEQMAATSTPTVSQGLNRVSNSFTNLIGEIDKTTGATNNAAKSLNSIADYLDDMPDTIDRVAQSWADFRARVNDAAGALNEFLGIDTSAEGLRKMGLEPAMPTLKRGDRPGATTGGTRFDDAFGMFTGIKPISIKDFAAPKKEKKGRKTKSEAEEYRDIVRAMQEKIAAQEVESRAIGMTAIEADKLRFAEEALAKMRREGVAETPERIAQIEQMAAKYAELAEQIRKQEEAARAAEEQAAFFGDLVTGALTDLIANGASAEDVVKRLAAALAEAAIQAAILGKGPLANLFGGASGGGLFGLLGGLFGGGTAPGRAGGGMVGAGRMYRVNELGSTEGFVPLTPGRVLNKQDMRGGGGPAITFAPVTQVAAGVTAPELRAILDQRDQQWRRTLPALVKDAASRRQL